MMCILLTALVLAATAASHLANPVNIYSTKSQGNSIYFLRL